MADWYSSRCALTWKLKGTKFNRLLFQLQPKTHRTEEIDVGSLLPTPTAMMDEAPIEKVDARNQKQMEKGNSPFILGLGQQAMRGMLPTPQSSDYIDKNTSKSWEAQGGVNFSLGNPKLRAMLPTPTAMDSTNATATMKSTQAQEGEKITGKENQDSMTKRVHQITGTTSQLNPRFVAEMMGFPPNWTELPFLNGERNQSKDTETP